MQGVINGRGPQLLEDDLGVGQKVGDGPSSASLLDLHGLAEEFAGGEPEELTRRWA